MDELNLDTILFVIAFMLVAAAGLLTTREMRRRALAEDQMRKSIEESRRVEAALRDSEERFRRAFDDAPIGMGLVSVDGQWLQVNQALCKIMGREQGELLATVFKQLTHPEDLDAYRAMVEVMLAGKLSSLQLEQRFFRKDGSTVFTTLGVSLLRDRAGNPLYFVAQVENISERKSAEALERTLRRTLEATNHDLVRRNKEIENFYHTLSHELKTPLTSAREFVSIVMDGLAGPLTETQREYLSIAQESCDQLRLCLNDLLDASRLETGKLSLEIKRGSLGRLVKRVVAAREPDAQAHLLDLSCEVPPELPDVMIDESRLTQVLNNLLGNAFKFTREGGRVSVKISSSEEWPGFLVAAISDTGRGIAKEQQSRIFDRLYQVKKSDADTEQGMGLGLYLCRELVLRHGGHIWVESEPGRGSTFFFTVPLALEPTGPAAEKAVFDSTVCSATLS